MELFFVGIALLSNVVMPLLSDGTKIGLWWTVVAWGFARLVRLLDEELGRR